MAETGHEAATRVRCEQQDIVAKVWGRCMRRHDAYEVLGGGSKMLRFTPADWLAQSKTKTDCSGQKSGTDHQPFRSYIGAVG